MPKRVRRWSPRGQGWRCLEDSGNHAWWVRRSGDDVENVVYISYGVHEGQVPPYWGIWSFSCLPGAHIMHILWDKPHRVSWLLPEREPDYSYYGITSVPTWRPVPQGPARRSPKTRGRQQYKRVHSMRSWCPQPYFSPYDYVHGDLPRRFR